MANGCPLHVWIQECLSTRSVADSQFPTDWSQGDIRVVEGSELDIELEIFDDFW